MPSLFTEELLENSNREIYRYRLLDWFNKECKNMRLGVSLDSNKCLHTFKPENPINFWFYKPQGEYDKAPICR